MPRRVAYIQVPVDQPGQDEAGHATTTCFALPGTNRDPSMSSCHFTCHVAVYDDLSVYLGIQGQISDPVLLNLYPVMLAASGKDWSWRWAGDHLTGQPSDAATWAANVDVKSGAGSLAPSWAAGRTADDVAGGSGFGWFIWNLSCNEPAETIPSGAASTNGCVRMGLLSDFGASTAGDDGYMYVGGTGTYDATDPIYPDPVRITVPGIMQYLDYYPFAVHHGSTWDSCNRDGGHTQVFRNSAWNDVKNVAVGEGTNAAHYFNEADWVVCPEIGEK